MDWPVSPGERLAQERVAPTCVFEVGGSFLPDAERVVALKFAFSGPKT